jgi:hypothetical protein
MPTENVMPRKTDSPNTRRNHFLYRASKAEPVKSLMRSYVEMGASPEELSKSWDRLARQALQLKRSVFNGVEIVPDITFDALTRAFAHFKLDPKDPLHWRHLLNNLAYIQFGERLKRSTGAKKKWTREEMEKLKTEIADRKLQAVSASDVASRLNKDNSSFFFNRGRETLRQKIGVLRSKV